jgi:hypothetical protein
MAFTSHRDIFNQHDEESRARDAVRRIQEKGEKSVAQLNELRRRRVALAKILRDKKTVVVAGQERKIVRVCEHTGTVFLRGKRGKEDRFTPEAVVDTATA